MTARRIGLIGWGAIATDVADGLVARGYAVTVLCRSGTGDRAMPAGAAQVADLPALLAATPDLVVETASQDAVRHLVPLCLDAGHAVLISSVGALTDAGLLAMLKETAERRGTHVVLPAGAIGGLDYVRAARHADDAVIVYESRKPVDAWRDELRALGVDPASLDAPLTLYEGDARGAASRYPANLNVAATLALAGRGFEGTQVRVVVDPAVDRNTHTITVESELGTMAISLANRPALTNPKSSMVVSRSILAATEQYFSSVKML
ncbi:MAG: aspartate dehydrogenase [Hyphomicrobiaceae bacterium]